MNIYSELDNLVSEFMALPSVDEKSLVDFEDKFSGLVFDYAKMVQEDDEELEKIFSKYFDILYREEMLSLFENFSVEVDTKTNLEFLGNLNLAKNYCFAKFYANRDKIAKSLRATAETFHCIMHEADYEAAVNVEQKLAGMMLGYIEEQFSTEKALLDFCKSSNTNKLNGLQVEIDYYLSYCFTAARNQYTFIFKHFVEDCLPEGYVNSVDSTISKSYKGDIPAEADEVSYDTITAPTGGAAFAAMKEMYEIVKFFSGHYSRPKDFIIETSKQLCNIVTGFLKKKSVGSANESAIVFDSFLYLRKRYGLSEAFEEYEDDLPSSVEILSYCTNENLTSYLEYLEAKDYDGAIAYNSEYEIAHYHKLLGYLSRLNTLSDIAKLTAAKREKIYFHWQHIGHTYDYYTEFFKYSEYLESLDTYDIDAVDFEDVLTILKYEAELSMKNSELQELNEKNRLMVKRYSHSWANLLYPDSVLKVAKTLSSDPQYRTESLNLMRAYNSETLLRQESYMLELRHSNDNLAVQQHIRKGISSKASADNKSVMDLIHYSLEMVLFRILMEDGERASYIRSILSRQGYSVDLIKEDFAAKIIYELESITSWFSRSFFQLRITIDDNWNKIYVSSDSGATAFIVEIFTELFLNALTYGSKTKDSKIDILLTTEDADNSSYLRIMCSNSLDKLDSFTGGTNDGLKSLGELLKMVNFNARVKSHRSSYLEQTEGSDFDLSLYIAKDLLIKKEVVL